mgnify:CR=1 FL=1
MANVSIDSSINDMLEWFQLEFPELWKEMGESTHHYSKTKVNPYHLEGSVQNHTLMVCLQARNFSPKNDLVRWSTLLHDIGKPLAREVVENTQKVRFIGHEGLSAFMAIDILNKTDISVSDKIMIHKIIASHGNLFRFINEDGSIKNTASEFFYREKKLLSNLIHQVNADSNGRFWNNNNSLDSYNLIERFESVIKNLDSTPIIKNEDLPTLTMLIGPPCSGKSTYREKLLKKEKGIVISMDDLMEIAGNKRGFQYLEAYKFLVSKENKQIKKREVDDILARDSVRAKKGNENVIIDMTCMTKKGRRKWINQYSKYNKKAVVFLTGFEELKRRNVKRAEETGKFIPNNVLESMCKNYTLPMYSEGFDEIEFVWQ